jgi:hypothetical protein
MCRRGMDEGEKERGEGKGEEERKKDENRLSFSFFLFFAPTILFSVFFLLPAAIFCIRLYIFENTKNDPE